MVAALPMGAPAPLDEYMSVAEVSSAYGIRKQGIYQAIDRGSLHPLRLPWLRPRVFFRSEIIAWRRRFEWRPTPQELEVLKTSGYPIEDFTPAIPGDPTTRFGLAGGSGALVAPADLMAYVQTVMREGQALTASAGAVVSEATAGAMRPWAENVAAGVQAPPDMADVANLAGQVVQGVVSPITDTIRASIAPISESLAQAAQARPAPLTDEVARQMGAIRVEVAAMLARLLEVMRPIVERVIAREPVTVEDAAPFMQLLGELTDALAGSPFYELAQSAIAQIPATLEDMNALRQAQAATHAPASGSVSSDISATSAGASSSAKGAQRSTR